MRKIPSIPCKIHIFVCANHRDPGGLPWCGAQGQSLFEALKTHVLNLRLTRDVWVTQTHCLGYCHAQGATLAIFRPGAPNSKPVFIQAAKDADLPTIIAQHVSPYL